MQVSTHPKELTREAVEKWLEDFKKKLKRTTSRDDLDRLILSVERHEFEDDDCAQWEEVIFENGKGKVSYYEGLTEEWAITSFQKMILDKNPKLEGRIIKRSELKEETGEWIIDQFLQQKLISSGGEAIVFEDKFGELEVAVRVQAFDSALFVEANDEMEFQINLYKDYGIAQNREEYDAQCIPAHPNVIKNFCNIEIYSSKDEKREDCLGWITIMEKCDSDLRRRLKNKDLSLEERKRIAIGVEEGRKYLGSIGIIHFDPKPENILLKNGKCKWIDFGTIWEETGRKSYRRMGFARRGSKYRYWQYLYAGSAAFSETQQLCKGGRRRKERSPLHVLILCDWKTAWSLLFKPIEGDEREKIKEELKACNAEWLSRGYPSIEKIENLSKIISLKNAVSDFCLDDPNLTKSSGISNLKQKLTRQINYDFKNLTKNVLNQNESNLCVPISVSVLLRWALKNDLKVKDLDMEEYFSLENIFIQLTMIIYPRSLAGFNLNPKKEEQEFQTNEIELLLRRMKFETYLNASGWEILKPGSIDANFDFERVLLHHKFAFSRPLTVTGCYLNPDFTIFFHQMVLDRIENSEFILQNTLIDHSGTQIRIPLSCEFYASEEMMKDCYNCYNDFVYFGDNNEYLELVNEQFNMKKEKWYLLPQAYSITLTPAASPAEPQKYSVSSESSDSENQASIFRKGKKKLQSAGRRLKKFFH